VNRHHVRANHPCGSPRLAEQALQPAGRCVCGRRTSFTATLRSISGPYSVYTTPAPPAPSRSSKT
jgi:hypothetical protein